MMVSCWRDTRVLTEAGVLSQSSCEMLRPWLAPGSDGVEGMSRQLPDSQLSTLFYQIP